MIIARAIALLAALVLSTASVGLHAQAAASGERPHAGAQGYPQNLYYIATPDGLIRQGVERLRGFLDARPEARPDEVNAFVARQIAPYFDFQYMAQWAAGPLYHRLSPAERTQLSLRLSQLFMNALAHHLGAIERPLPRVDVFPARPGQSMSDAVVYARVVGAQMQTRLEFRFYWNGTQWKVYDAAANGSSAVAYYRRYFTTLLRRFGPEALFR